MLQTYTPAEVKGKKFGNHSFLWEMKNQTNELNPLQEGRKKPSELSTSLKP